MLTEAVAASRCRRAARPHAVPGGGPAGRGRRRGDAVARADRGAGTGLPARPVQHGHLLRTGRDRGVHVERPWRAGTGGALHSPGGRGERRRSAPPRWGRWSGSAGRSGRRGASTRSRTAPTWWSWRAASAWRRCGGRSATSWQRQQAGRGRVFVLVGARSPDQILFHEDLRPGSRRASTWASPSTSAAPGWMGLVGVVTALLPGAPFEASGSLAPALRSRDHDALRWPRPGGPGGRPRARPGLAGAQHAVRHRPVRPLPARAAAGVPRRPDRPLRGPGRRLFMERNR